MENKNKRMCDKDVQQLIKARIAHRELFKQKFYRRDDVWLQIQRTGNLGHYTLNQIRYKWNYLFKKYKELTAPSTGIGTEDGKDTADSWKWYTIMHEFAHGQHMISPLIALSSVRGCTTTNNFESDTVEMGEEYLEDEFLLIEDSSTQSTSSTSRDSATPSTSSAPSTSSGGSSSRNSAPRGRRRLQKEKNSIIELFKKEAKRSKKEGKCILQFLNEYSKKNEMQFNMPSSSSDSD